MLSHLFPPLFMKKFFATKNDYGMLLLRVTAGAAMLPFGLAKIGVIAGPGFSGTIGYFGTLGIPAFITVLVMTLRDKGLMGTWGAAAGIAVTSIVFITSC